MLLALRRRLSQVWAARVASLREELWLEEGERVAFNRTLPLTGSGDATAAVATDTVAGVDYQQVKIVDGTVGSTIPAIVTAAGAQKVDGSAVTQPVSNSDFVSQGAAEAAQTGPLVQAVASDAPPSYADGEIHPLTMTPEGRLRVSTHPADIDLAWHQTDPWQGDSSWGREGMLSYV